MTFMENLQNLDKNLTTGFRVLHVTETGIGGVASYLDELLPLQANVYGADAVRLILPASHAAHLKQVATRSINGFRDRSGRLSNTWELTKQVKKEMRVFRPHMIHIHSSYAGFALRPLMWLRRERPRVVYCPHGWAFSRDTSRLVTELVKHVELAWSRLCDAIICISKHEYDSGLQIGIAPERLNVILNGISTNVIPSIAPVRWPVGKLRVLFVGRFDHQKGVDIFIDAMSQLEDFAFGYVVGAPAIDSDLSPRIAVNVSFAGWQSRESLEAYYRSADVLVMPSRWEGFGLTAIEAMRAGLAVIASRVGGLKEIVEDGISGILVEPNNPSAIENALRRSNQEMLSLMGNAGRSRFKRLFSADRMFNDVHRLYKDLLFR